jgi:outer membrane protein assembly factor BamB
MNFTRRRLLASAAGLCVISGCLGSSENSGRSLPTTPTGAWNQSGNDARNTSNPDVTVPDRGTQAWSGGSGLITPLVVDETVYTVDDVLTALDTQTGDVQWQTRLDIEESPNSATQPAVAGEQILLASEDQLAAFDTVDGSTRWDRTITGLPGGPITVDTDRQLGFTLFQRPEQSESTSELVAFDVESGDTTWTAPLGGLSSAPAVFEDHVYVTGRAGPDTRVLRCLDVDSGGLVWEREPEDPKTRPVCTDTGVLVGENAVISVYDHSNGMRLASVGVPNEQIRAIAVDNGTVFVLAGSGLSAVSIPDGEERWSRGENQARADGLAVGDNSIVAPVSQESLGSGPSVAAFDRADGTLRWRYVVDGVFSPKIVSQPVLADGAVFAMSNTETGVTALGDLPPQGEEETSS